MKRIQYMGLALLISLSLLAGCATTPATKSSAKKTTATKKSKKDLYSMVPAALRAPVREAQYDLKQANAKVKKAGEKVKLAELQKERVILEKKYADLEMKIAEKRVKKAELAVEVKKAQAIERANLGDEEDNIKRVANLRAKELTADSDIIKVKALLDTTALKIKRITKKIRAQDRKVYGKTKK